MPAAGVSVRRDERGKYEEIDLLFQSYFIAFSHGIRSLVKIRNGKAVNNLKENRTVNELLRACRERAQMTQEELAKILGVERSTISKVETFIIKNPSYSLVRQWCAATHGVDLMTLDLNGGIEGWKKLQKLEQMMRTMQDALATASMQRKSNEGAKNDVGTGRSSVRSLFGRIRS